MSSSLDSLRAELDAELQKRDRIRQQQLARYADRSATRARTTTSNANADWCNERIACLRTQIRVLETQIGVSP